MDCNRMKKRTIAFVLAFALLATGAWIGLADSRSYAAENTTDFAGGDGSAENPFRIETVGQLNKVRAYHLEGTTYVYGGFSTVKSLKL